LKPGEGVREWLERADQGRGDGQGPPADGSSRAACRRKRLLRFPGRTRFIPHWTRKREYEVRRGRTSWKLMKPTRPGQAEVLTAQYKTNKEPVPCSPMALVAGHVQTSAGRKRDWNRGSALLLAIRRGHTPLPAAEPRTARPPVSLVRAVCAASPDDPFTGKPFHYESRWQQRLTSEVVRPRARKRKAAFNRPLTR